LLYTGLTRDGVFWIEDGKVTHPVNNFRWNESPVRVLEKAIACSRAVRIGGRGGGARNALVPALQVGEFALTSVSEAV
jgi:predicted Zn-dependent protease